LLFNAWTVIGDPGTVARGLTDLAAKTGADELMIVPIERDGAGRIRTLRLIAEGRSQGAAAPLRVAVGAGSPVQPG
jgi:alkanesulfonate monooxygenase SsuD/methylene tetrahydromethanopterin reductase-like flavin-dependent oxidoreductase (luciferase family)